MIDLSKSFIVKMKFLALLLIFVLAINTCSALAIQSVSFWSFSSFFMTIFSKLDPNPQAASSTAENFCVPVAPNAIQLDLQEDSIIWHV